MFRAVVVEPIDAMKFVRVEKVSCCDIHTRRQPFILSERVLVVLGVCDLIGYHSTGRQHEGVGLLLHRLLHNCAVSWY
jgi:hypothetical protein